MKNKIIFALMLIISINAFGQKNNLEIVLVLESDQSYNKPVEIKITDLDGNEKEIPFTDAPKNGIIMRSLKEGSYIITATAAPNKDYKGSREIKIENQAVNYKAVITLSKNLVTTTGIGSTNDATEYSISVKGSAYNLCLKNINFVLSIGRINRTGINIKLNPVPVNEDTTSYKLVRNGKVDFAIVQYDAIDPKDLKNKIDIILPVGYEYAHLIVNGKESKKKLTDIKKIKTANSSYGMYKTAYNITDTLNKELSEIAIEKIAIEFEDIVEGEAIFFVDIKPSNLIAKNQSFFDNYTIIPCYDDKLKNKYGEKKELSKESYGKLSTSIETFGVAFVLICRKGIDDAHKNHIAQMILMGHSTLKQDPTNPIWQFNYKTDFSNIKPLLSEDIQKLIEDKKN